MLMVQDHWTSLHESPTDRILSRLDAVKRSRTGWTSRCPAHADGRPSLAISEGDDNRVLLHCFAGCSTAAICDAIGLQASDLFIRDERPSGPTAYVSGERVTYDFHDAAGTLVFQEIRDPPKRFWLRRPDGRGGWTKGLDGVERELYRLPELLAEPDRWVALCEGCKDADRLRILGLLATTIAGGSNAPWTDRYSEVLQGRHVVVFADNDASGIACAHTRAQALQGIASTVKVIELPDLPAKGDVSDWLDAGHTKDELLATVRDTPRWTPDTAPAGVQPITGGDADPDPWDDPIPLDDPEGPPFPIGSLPGTIGAYVAAVANQTQTPIDMAAIIALGTLSAAAGGRYVVEGSRQGWIEPAHVMLAVVAEPGNRKSAVIRTVTEPIERYERDVNPDERVAFAQWESRSRTLEKAVASAESAASRPAADDALTDGEAVRMAAVDALEAHKATRPRITRIVYDDVTAQAANSALAEQGGAIAVMSGESAFLSNTAGGRYADAPNIDVILSGHAADSIRVDRRGRPSETIDRACLTLCLMVQPDVIRDLGKSPGFMQRGGAARLLPCFPADNLGHRQIDVTHVPANLSAAWSSLIMGILSHIPPMRDGGYVPWVLDLDAETLTEFRAFRLWHEPRMARDGAFATIRDWCGKQPGAVLRIAGLLHIASHATPERVAIGAETVHQAITIASYFEAHARIMYGIMRGRSNHADARTVLDAIRRLETPITQRDVHRLLHNRAAFATADDLRAPLEVLEAHGWIRRERETGDKGGRPTERIFLNPAVMDDRTDRTPPLGGSSLGSVGSVMVFPRSRVPIDPTGTDDVEYF